MDELTVPSPSSWAAHLTVLWKKHLNLCLFKPRFFYFIFPHFLHQARITGQLILQGAQLWCLLLTETIEKLCEQSPSDEGQFDPWRLFLKSMKGLMEPCHLCLYLVSFPLSPRLFDILLEFRYFEAPLEEGNWFLMFFDIPKSWSIIPDFKNSVQSCCGTLTELIGTFLHIWLLISRLWKATWRLHLSL